MTGRKKPAPKPDDTVEHGVTLERDASGKLTRLGGDVDVTLAEIDPLSAGNEIFDILDVLVAFAGQDRDDATAITIAIMERHVAAMGYATEVASQARNGAASGPSVAEALRTGARIQAAADAKQQRQQQAKAVPTTAPVIVVERDEAGRPVGVTEQHADGTLTVKTIEHDDAGRIIRIAQASEK